MYILDLMFYGLREIFVCLFLSISIRVLFDIKALES